MNEWYANRISPISRFKVPHKKFTVGPEGARPILENLEKWENRANGVGNDSPDKPLAR
jgi:hypothetical protein